MLASSDRLAARFARARRVPRARSALPVLLPAARVPRALALTAPDARERHVSRTISLRNGLRFLGYVSDRSRGLSCAPPKRSASGAVLSAVQSVVSHSIPVLRDFEPVAPPTRPLHTPPVAPAPTCLQHIWSRDVARLHSRCQRVRTSRIFVLCIV